VPRCQGLASDSPSAVLTLICAMAMAPRVQRIEVLRGGGAGPAVVALISLVGVSYVVAERLDVGLLVLAGGGQRDADVLIGAISCGVRVGPP
jgi:hypothetical protein